MTQPRFLFTGTGRCGTGFISRLCTRLGIVTGHEIYFSPRYISQHLALEMFLRDDISEASWLAMACNLSKIEAAGIRIVHVYRDPQKVWESLSRIRFFSHREHIEYRAVAHLICPVLAHSRDEAEAATIWIRHVHSHLARFPAIKIDSPTFVRDFGQLIDRPQWSIKQAQLTLPKEINSRRGAPMPDWYEKSPSSAAILEGI